MKKTFLYLGNQPITNNYLKSLKKSEIKKEFFYKLKVSYNEKNNLVSLSNFVQPKKMFNENYAHRASMSKTMLNSFKKLAIKLNHKFKPKRILEIGSNDGVFIRNFDKKKIIAVEPCKNLAKLTNKMGYKTYPFFWDFKLSKKIENKFGKVDLIYSANTISHIPNLIEVFKSIKSILKKEGVFVFEDPYILSVIKNTSYDQFYDEHAHVFSLIAVENLVKKFDLKVIDLEHLKTHGGSMRYYIAHEDSNFKVEKIVKKTHKIELQYKLNKFSTYKKFGKKVEKSKIKLLKLLKKLKKNNKTIVSYGATYKSATIFNYCKIDKNLIDYVIDTTKNKQNKFTPGSHLKIFPPEKQPLKKIDYYFLGAWNFKNEILLKEKKYILGGGKFISHVPEVKIL
ncbi:methyltransferase domain-containing protein [Pelagibacterales bacterium SAG-MED06]|nr:methyltransferase domain-containing protein [Pelagibacterales bacterium SAG-MED06]